MELSMLVDICDYDKDWGSVVEIAANSGIQFLDFNFDANSLRGFESDFFENQNEQGIVVLSKIDVGSHSEHEVQYSISVQDILASYLGHWVPIPYFSSDQARQDGGPFNWARARLDYTSEANKDSLQLQVALDTTVLIEGDHQYYLQPSFNDADVEREYLFSSKFEIIKQLIRNGCEDPETFNIEDDGAWVSDWVKSIHGQYIDDGSYNQLLHPNSQLEPWALFVAFIELIASAANFPTLKIKHSAYSLKTAASVDVDLILDIGNSRTCGLLVEHPHSNQSQNQLDLESISQISLRDLNDPRFEYSGLFESRVEFADQVFGEDRFSRLSGRNNAFLWPSFVRFGPEALRLISKDRGNEEYSGLSSPKRYLWDNSLFTQRWRIHNRESNSRLPRSMAAVLPELTAAGDNKAQLLDEVSKRLRDPRDLNLGKTATHAEFSKSSLYGFMIAEVIAQVFRQINDPKYRGSKASKTVARSLKRVIITLPTATPRQEQAIVKSKVKGAIKLLWSRMIKMGQVTAKSEPEVIIEWDEASCTQVMYLYSEIIHKFDGKISDFLSAYGKKRRHPEFEGQDDLKDVNSLKIACIDIGGGTTDVMVTTYYQQEQVELHPVQEFREGFRQAGDDLLASIIENLIIGKIIDAASTNVNRVEIQAKIMNIFGKSVAGRTTSQRHAQRQFTIKFFAPLALEILNLDFGDKTSKRVCIKDFEFSKNLNEVCDYIELPFSGLADNWKLLGLEFEVKKSELSQLIEEVFRLVFENISEVISHLNVDCILLTGRTTQNDKVKDLLKNICAISPNRVIAISDYHTGSWYPFRGAQNTVGDPKSSVAVGAMLIALTGSQRVSGLYIKSDSFSMRPVDKYIGRLENSSQVKAADLYFFPEMDGEECEISMMTDTFIGSRQLDVDWWTATPLYKLYFVETGKGKLPLKVTLQKRPITNGSHDDKLTRDAVKEPIVIANAVDAEGKPMKRHVAFRLQTLGITEEYWLDTGAFRI
jgi:hypothetical protein